ncbi:hydroxyethylthiazole kinase [Aerococcus christensenii]
MKKEEVQAAIIEAVHQVKSTNPMAPSITNTVTINFVANTQIAVGGSAAMVYMPDEGKTMANIAQAMYINVGTIFPIYEETLPQTAAKLHELGKNWVVDPVAIGIGELRTKLLNDFKPYKPSIIRGNASEVIALAHLWHLLDHPSESKVRGVDSTESVDQATEAALALALYTGGAVSVSGKTDLVTDGHHIAHSHGGSSFMGKITGAGCSLGGVTAVYACVTDPFIAALTACQVFNLAGSRAEAKVKAPGSFQPQFIDELYLASAEDIAHNPFDFVTL